LVTALRTGLTDQTVRQLSIMRDEGTVELIGSSSRSSIARYRRTPRIAFLTA
jgi:ATP-dependent DNA helicase RecG